MQLSIPCHLAEEHARSVFHDWVRQMRYFFGNVAALHEDAPAFAVWQPNPYLEPAVREAWVEARSGRIVITCTPDAATPANVALLVNELEQLVSFPARPVARRVFGVGWQKTGTASLALALRSLGYLTCHFAPWTIGHEHYGDAADGRIDLDWIARYGAVLDIPAAALYRELDQRFPGSLFVLTTRSEGVWLDSVEHHVTRCKRALGQLASVDRWAYGCSRAIASKP